MKFLFVSLLLLAVFLTVSIGGFYPAAVVNGSIITFREWRKLEEASKRFANAERARRGERPLNFAAVENSVLLVEGRKTTLGALIEGQIIVGEGRRLVPDFDQKSEENIVEALRRAPNFKQGVESLYGISYEDFKVMVLLPQARMELLKEALEKHSINFEERLGEAKRQANVRLLFVPFHWNGEGIR